MTCPPTDLAGPSCRARRRPSVATAVSLSASARAARRPGRSGCSRCRWRRPCGGSISRKNRAGISWYFSSSNGATRWETRPGSPTASWNSLRWPRTSVLRPSLSSVELLVGAFAQDRAERGAIGSTTLPGASTSKPGTSMRMPTSRSVPISVAPSVVASSLTFCRIGLGLRAGRHAGRHLERVGELLAVTYELHGLASTFLKILTVVVLVCGRRLLVTGETAMLTVKRALTLACAVAWPKTCRLLVAAAPAGGLTALMVVVAGPACLFVVHPAINRASTLFPQCRRPVSTPRRRRATLAVCGSRAARSCGRGRRSSGRSRRSWFG